MESSGCIARIQRRPLRWCTVRIAVSAPSCITIRVKWARQEEKKDSTSERREEAWMKYGETLTVTYRRGPSLPSRESGNGVLMIFRRALPTRTTLLTYLPLQGNVYCNLQISMSIVLFKRWWYHTLQPSTQISQFCASHYMPHILILPNRQDVIFNPELS